MWMGTPTTLVTKQKADIGECRNNVYRLPLWVWSEKLDKVIKLAVTKCLERYKIYHSTILSA